MNQHDRVEQLLADHDEQAQKARNIATALGAIECVLGLLAEHVDCGSYNARYELTNGLDNVRRAVRNVEKDL